MRWGMLAATLAAVAGFAAGQAQAAKPAIPPPLVAIKAPQGANARSVKLVGWTFNQTPTTKIGLLQASPLCVGADYIYIGDVLTRVSKTDFAQTFEREARAAGFPVSGQAGDLFVSEETPQFEIGLRVVKVEGDICTPLYGQEKMKGWVALEAEWQVFSPAKKAVVARIPVKVVAEKKEVGPPQEVFLAGFAEATKALLNDQGYRDVVLSAEPDVRAGVGAPSAIAAATGAAPAAQAERATITLGAPERKPDGLTEVVGSVVTIVAGGGHGSGFLVSADGHVLTNQHVVGDAKTVKVRWSDNYESVGEVLRAEKGRDVALIKTDSRSRLPLAMRRGGVSLGQEVYAVGAPLNIGLSGTVTRGVVSTTNRIFDGYAFIQSDVQVTNGNSGGPLVNKDGEVLGLTVLGYRPDGVPNAVNLFIPAGDAMDFLGLK